MHREKDRHVILAYMDESGEAQYGKTIEKRPHFLRSCLIIPENQLADVEGAVQKLLDGFPLCSKTGDKCRFHAKDLFWQTGDWAEYKDDFETTITALFGMAEIIQKHKLYVTFGHIMKPQIVKTYQRPYTPAVLTFMQCGHIMERWMYAFARDQRWLPCVGTSDYDRDVREIFHECRRSGSPIRNGLKWKRACDVIAFTSPASSDLFLISDFCAFMFSRKKQAKDDWMIKLHDHLRPYIWNPWTFNPGGS
jgi:hypothetical protein